MLSRSLSPTNSTSSRSPSPPLALDPSTLALLNDFYYERTQLEDEFEALQAKVPTRPDEAGANQEGERRISVEEFRRLFSEDWQMSQFWYSTAFTRVLSHFVATLIPSSATIAFISCPTGYVGFTHSKPSYPSVKLLEFDERFEVIAGKDFYKWNLNKPLEGVEELKGKVDFAVVDPPFLNEVTNEAFATCLSHILVPSTGKFLLLTSTSVTNLSSVYSSLLAPDMSELFEISDRLQPTHAGGFANAYGSWLSWTPDQGVLEKALVWGDEE